MPVRLRFGAGFRFAAVTGGLFQSGVSQPPGEPFCVGGACASAIDAATTAGATTRTSRTLRFIDGPPSARLYHVPACYSFRLCALETGAQVRSLSAINRQPNALRP